jgi:hypothetical protein
VAIDELPLQKLNEFAQPPSPQHPEVAREPEKVVANKRLLLLTLPTQPYKLHTYSGDLELAKTRFL